MTFIYFCGGQGVHGRRWWKVEGVAIYRVDLVCR